MTPLPPPRRSTAASGRRAERSRGFTLIEVLVSLLILAVLAGTAWKGVDAITTARQVADGNLKQTLRLQSVMTQLESDLAQVMDTLVVTGLQFDGANLRMTRRSGTGVQVVVWSLREGRWLRWASPPTSRVGELQDFWLRSMQLQGREAGTLTALKGVAQWQVWFHDELPVHRQCHANTQRGRRQDRGHRRCGRRTHGVARAVARGDPLPLDLGRGQWLCGHAHA